jgi:hypothetical protein
VGRPCSSDMGKTGALTGLPGRLSGATHSEKLGVTPLPGLPYRGAEVIETHVHKDFHSGCTLSSAKQSLIVAPGMCLAFARC